MFLFLTNTNVNSLHIASKGNVLKLHMHMQQWTMLQLNAKNRGSHTKGSPLLNQQLNNVLRKKEKFKQGWQFYSLH